MRNLNLLLLFEPQAVVDLAGDQPAPPPAADDTNSAATAASPPAPPAPGSTDDAAAKHDADDLDDILAAAADELLASEASLAAAAAATSPTTAAAATPAIPAAEAPKSAAEAARLRRRARILASSSQRMALVNGDRIPSGGGHTLDSAPSPTSATAGAAVTDSDGTMGEGRRAISAAQIAANRASVPTTVPPAPRRTRPSDGVSTASAAASQQQQQQSKGNARLSSRPLNTALLNAHSDRREAAAALQSTQQRATGSTVCSSVLAPLRLLLQSAVPLTMVLIGVAVGLLLVPAARRCAEMTLESTAANEKTAAHTFDARAALESYLNTNSVAAASQQQRELKLQGGRSEVEATVEDELPSLLSAGGAEDILAGLAARSGAVAAALAAVFWVLESAAAVVAAPLGYACVPLVLLAVAARLLVGG